MDGVLCDFDKGYENLTGESTDEANAKVNLIFGNFLEKVLEKMKKNFGLTYLGNPEEKNFGDILSNINRIYYHLPQ
jgi:hypothetical protein